ncbi:MAG TPA: co-chaperone GroES [Gammaproteobacteria bacterium]|nr:co-chaperone GroES [Gammaproteobacteria bacterium]
MTTIALPPDELILPPGIQRIEDPDEPDEPKATMLPIPTGFHLLCAVPRMPEEFEDSVLLKARQTIVNDEAATTVLFVLALGPDAYADKTRFPSGPWCKKGDFIIVRTYSGTRFKVFGKEFRVLNDDMVDAVVSDPRGILRAQA